MQYKGVILAAGNSSRFTSLKALAFVDEHNKISLIEHAVTTMNNSQLSTCYVALQTGGVHQESQQKHQQIASLITAKAKPETKTNSKPKAIVIECPNAAKGLGHSISDVTTALEQSTSHLLITLADQVALTSQDYDRLLAASKAEPEKIVCAESEVGIGAPAIFPNAYFSELKSLKGDKGAKQVLMANRDNLRPIPIKNAALDIDTQEDLQAWTALAKAVLNKQPDIIKQ